MLIGRNIRISSTSKQENNIIKMKNINSYCAGVGETRGEVRKNKIKIHYNILLYRRGVEYSFKNLLLLFFLTYSPSCDRLFT